MKLTLESRGRTKGAEERARDKVSEKQEKEIR